MAFKSDNDTLILGVLAERSLHGYEISKQIKLKTKDAMTLPENKLYPALHHLEEQGYISAEWIPQQGKPDRKVYSITKSGVKELENQRSAWQRFVANINSVVLGTEAKEGK